MEPITEEEARNILKSVRSPAGNPKKYIAKRVDHGWLFIWPIESGPPLMGTRSWVVADNGQLRVVDIADHVSDVIAVALSQDDNKL